ncbi:hypothetical protein J0K78_18775 [Halobacillus sp. GSS1]|nr:hypothetical protein [Halobacillus sp. GSS1]MBN9656314.1 hypothetical protein [Halobacillus sp. GSS1]
MEWFFSVIFLISFAFIYLSIKKIVKVTPSTGERNDEQIVLLMVIF